MAHVKNRSFNFAYHYVRWAGLELVDRHAQWHAAFTATTRLKKQDGAVFGSEFMYEPYGGWGSGYACGRHDGFRIKVIGNIKAKKEAELIRLLILSPFKFQNKPKLVSQKLEET
jgi:hypothetical protein